MTVQSRRKMPRLTAAIGWSVCGLIAGVLALGACADSIPVGESMDASTQGGDGGQTFVPDSGSDVVLVPLQCATANCAPGYATCANSTFVCDVDLTSNNSNCGACGVVCPNDGSALNARSVCADGRCQLTCNAGYADCNGIIDDGCEQPLDEHDNCGACGHACADDEPCLDITPNVHIGKCGCPGGQTWCGTECVDLTDDDKNCGSCGNACPPPPDGAPELGPNMHYGCIAGECANPKCDPPGGSPPQGHADCNDNTSDGCETNVFGDDDNCGQCGRKCPAGTICAILTPENVVDCACGAGKTRCTHDSDPGFASCVDLLTDNENCGACGARCPGNEGVICDNGECVQMCPDGLAECNGNPADPCETNIMTDPYNCGGCGIRCDDSLPQACQGGKCWTEPCDGGGPVVQ